MKRYLLVIAIVFAGISVSAQSTDNTQSKKSEGPGTYKILNKDSGPIRIPFKIHNGKPLLDVEINGEKSTLMIDNGVLWDQIWLFGSLVVEKLDLKPQDEMLIGGAGEGDPTAAFTSSNLTIKFKDIVFYEQPVLVSPSAAGFSRMFPGTDGQLCNTFFKHFIVEFDFIKNEVILHNPTQFEYTGEGSVLDLTPSESGSNDIPFSFTMLDGKVLNGRVDVDFGGIHELRIALNNKHNIQLPTETEELESFGAQGRTPEYKGEIESMTIGKYKIERPTVYYSDETNARVHPDNLGTVGLPLFMRFDIIFDYINHKMYIDPNSRFDN